MAKFQVDIYPLKVFVSYSHEDRGWLERVHVHLKPLVRHGKVEIWDDSQILPGSNWHREIETALATARVAVLLVSPEFLASDFITDNELPPLLAAAERRGTRILPIIVSPSRFESTELGKFQAVNAPEKPLAKLTKAEQDEILVKLSKIIDNLLYEEERAVKALNQLFGVSFEQKRKGGSYSVKIFFSDWHQREWQQGLIIYSETQSVYSYPVDKLFGHLGQLWRLQELEINAPILWDPDLVSPLARLKNLKVLRLANMGVKVTDLSPLAGLKNLEVLKTYGLKVTDLSPLAGLKNLEVLGLSGVEVNDLTPLAGLNNLEELVIECTGKGVSDLSDLCPLAGLSNLRRLALTGCMNISDLSPLAELGNLQELDISWLYLLSDFDFSLLAKLDNLRTVYVYTTFGNMDDKSEKIKRKIIKALPEVKVPPLSPPYDSRDSRWGPHVE